MSEHGLTELLFMHWTTQSALAFSSCGCVNLVHLYTVFSFRLISLVGQAKSVQIVIYRGSAVCSNLIAFACVATLLFLFRLLVCKLKCYLMQCDILGTWKKPWNLLKEIFIEVQRRSSVLLFAKELHGNKIVILLILHKKLMTINFGSCYTLLLHATWLSHINFFGRKQLQLLVKFL